MSTMTEGYSTIIIVNGVEARIGEQYVAKPSDTGNTYTFGFKHALRFLRASLRGQNPKITIIETEEYRKGK